MTRADQIRSASDEELAAMFAALMSRHRQMIFERLRAAGLDINVTVVEMPILTQAAHLEWLRETVEAE